MNTNGGPAPEESHGKLFFRFARSIAVNREAADLTSEAFLALRGNLGDRRIAAPCATAKDKENLRIPFNPHGRLAAILKRRAALGPEAYVFGSTHGAYQPPIQMGPKCLFENARPEPVFR